MIKAVDVDIDVNPGSVKQPNGTVLANTFGISAIPSAFVPSSPFYSIFISAAAVSTWTKTVGPAASAYVDAAWSPVLGLFVAGATDGSVKTSSNGVNWTLRTAANDSDWHGIVWADALGGRYENGVKRTIRCCWWRKYKRGYDLTGWYNMDS